MAGLLDSLFNPSLYGGQNGGLLDFLQSSQMQQNNYKPSEGFAPATPQPAQPIMIGSTQMPRIGDAAQFDPAQVNIPQNAQPTQGQMPVMPQQAGPDLSERIGAGLMNFANAGGILPALAGGVSGLMTGQRTDRLGNANQTAQFLVTKGIDPVLAKTIAADPHLMRSVLPSLIGTGGQTDDIKEYNFARQQEPNLTFQQFMQRKRGKDQNASYVLGRGGEVIKNNPDGTVTVVHKNAAEEAILDDQTTAAMASQYLAGDRTVMQNLGRGAQGATNVVKLRNEIYKQAQGSGLNGRDIVENFNEQAGALAGQRAVGTRAANISLAANEANNMIPIALAASDKLPRSQYMPWNQMVQAVQKGSSSPELASFVAATNSLVNSYVRAVSPSGVPTDSMREHAYSMLNAAQGPEAYKAVIETMKQEMNAALEAPTQVKKELRHKPEAPSAPAASPQASDAGWTDLGGVKIRKKQ